VIQAAGEQAKVRDVAIVVIEPRNFEVSVAGQTSRFAVSP